MARLIVVAAALLVVQLGVVVALNYVDQGDGQYRPGGLFLDFSAAAVDRLEITGEQGEKMVLARGEKGWILPDHAGAPAALTQVRSLLEKLAGLTAGLVVAGSEEAATRFQVADDGFQRHIVLRAGNEVVGDFYVGTSPGFRQVHARRAGEDAVVTLSLSAFELETALEGWLDKEQVKIPADQLIGVVYPDFTLQRRDDGWRLDDQAADETLEEAAVDDLTLRVGSLTIQSVIDPAEASPLFKGEPQLSYALLLADGRHLEYRFAKMATGESYALHVSDREFFYKVHHLPVEGLRKITRHSLLPAPVEAD